MAESFYGRLENAALFDTVSDPVWICDPECLTIRGINRAGVEALGYDASEQASLTISDVVVDADLACLMLAVQGFPGVAAEAEECWRVKCKDGTALEAKVSWRLYGVHSPELLVVSFRDLRVPALRNGSGQDPVAGDPVRREHLEINGELFRRLFEAAPGRCVVLTPLSYEIVAVSDAYLEATMTERDAILGKALFDVFPDDPDDPAADGSSKLRFSLNRVETTGNTDVMAVQRYPVPRPASEGGGFELRYWSPVNTPVHGPDGNLDLIIHRVEDVTEYVLKGGSELGLEQLDGRASDLLRELVLRSRELSAVCERLHEQAAYFNAAQKLLGFGMWSMDLATSELTWKDSVHAIYGVDPSVVVKDVDSYVQLVHPGDRDALLANLNDWLADQISHFEFRHRVIGRDGAVIHVQGLADVVEVEGRRQLIGVVHDLTARVWEAEVLAQSQNLSRIAGKTARLGGWRADLVTGVTHWSEETAAIHELDGGSRTLTVDEGLHFYRPEHRDIINRLFEQCAEAGTPFDTVLEITTAKGNRRSVRSIGEAERGPWGDIIAVQGAFQDITEQVAARHALKELTEKLHSTLENMPDPFLLLDSQLRFEYVNAAGERALRAGREVLIGSPIHVAFPHDDTRQFEQHYRRAMDSGQSQHFFAVFRPLNAHFRVDAYPVPNGVAIYFRDVTQEHEREQQLRLLETAVAQQSDMLLITEAHPIDAPDGPRIVYANNAFLQRTGFALEEVLGNTPRLLQGPETDRATLDRIKAALWRSEPVREELLNYTKDGESYWLELDIVPLFDAGGAVSHFVAVERDVTERKTMEHALHASDQRFQLVARATNDLIWDWDPAEDTLWWSDAIESLFGYKRESLKLESNAWSSRIHPAEREGVRASVAAAIDSNESYWTREYRFLHADGSFRTVVDRGYIVRNDAGQAVRMVGSINDITEQRRMAEELRQSQKLEAIGQLTGGIAHDFNNLLTVIMGNAELLVEELSESSQLGPLAAMTASAAFRGAELTNRLLAFARRQPLEPQILNANRLLSGLEGLLRRTLGEDIEIELVQAGGLWNTEVDAGQLESAILNLALNARDAMPGGGLLTIETANARLDDSYADSHLEVSAGQYVLISLTDSGAGMPAEVMTRAFEPFFTTKMHGKGSGLGLSMVYGFVKQSGGHLKLYSETGEGTTVKLYFPRAMGVLAATAAEQSGLPVSGGKEHILVVEDDAMVRQHVTNVLEGLGYRTTSAESGAEALRFIEEREDIDLLFTDIVMPGGMNGRQLAEQTSVVRPGLKVLFTSGYTENAIVHHGRLDAGVQLLSKPYRRQELAAKVRRVLSGSA